MSENKFKFFVQQVCRNQRTAVLTGCIKFSDLRNRVRYSFRSDSDDSEYQRQLDPKRVASIAKYLNTSIAARLRGEPAPIFPTSIILAFSESDNLNSIFDSDSKCDEIQLKSLGDDILIVDGQHRFAGMESLYEDLRSQDPDLFDDTHKAIKFIENYRFNCSVLLNYDIWQQAQVFASVNFNQKKVNKSLFYDIYGIQMPDNDSVTIPKQNEIWVSHLIVKWLNDVSISPFYQFVKMLGSGPGFISQAFLVEQLIRLMSTGGIWADVTNDVKSGNEKKLQNYATMEIYSYFDAIKKVFPQYWPKSESDKTTGSILFKTTGVGAMIRFMTELHNCIDDDELKNFKKAPLNAEYRNKIFAHFTKHLKKLAPSAEMLFSTGENGKFHGTGGKGLESRLYHKICEIWSNN